MPCKQRGRPRGHFEFMVERTRRLVANLADASHCNASDRFLAHRLGCSERSVRRYVLALKQRGVLSKTTVAYRRGGRWMRKRLMKMASDKVFGLTRDEVMAFNNRRAAPAPKKPEVTWKEPVRLPYFQGPKLADPNSGWGDPYHEDITSGDRPIDAKILPKTVLDDMKARLQGMLDAPDPLPADHQKLRSRYILASIKRARRDGGVYPLGVLDR